MEALLYTANINSLIPSSSSSGAGGGSSCWENTSAWTKEENKRFERALALFDETTPDRWTRVAEMLPGKSVWEVMKQYQVLEEDVSVIEAGLDDYDDDDDENSRRKKKKPPLAPAASSLSWSSWTGGQNDRRKGVPWTEEEHRRFLVGLSKHGKGDWRSISRKFVMSKTPTQVASHAQKYFLRQMSVAKDKKRPSIHDITTANLAVLMPPPPPSITVHLV